MILQFIAILAHKVYLTNLCFLNTIVLDDQFYRCAYAHIQEVIFQRVELLNLPCILEGT